MREVDAGICASWLQVDRPASSAADGACVSTLQKLIREERIQGALFESYSQSADTWHTQSIGISRFVHADVIDAHLARPEAFLIHELVARAADQAPRHFMGPDDQALANASAAAGLDLVAHWMQKNWNTDDPHWRPIYMMAHENFIEVHRGFRINRMFHEDWTRAVDIYEALGYRVHSAFEIGAARTPRRLYYMDRREILGQAPGSAASYLLQYTDPVCSFTRSEQRLLLRAWRAAPISNSPSISICRSTR